MPRFNVKYHDKWACFSSVSDKFVTAFMEKSNYEKWRKGQYGMCNYKPAEQCNIMTMKEAVSSIRMHSTHVESFIQLFNVGISPDECEKLLYDMETECYCPILKENGKYECPNCHSEVYLDQVSCEVEDCGIEFVWRPLKMFLKYGENEN